MYLRNFLAQNGHSPTFKEIQSEFGFKSSSTVAHYINTLATRGLIQRIPGAAGSIRIMTTPDTMGVNNE